jgi:hypothetical protein
MSLTFGNTVFEHEVTVGGVRNNLIGEDFITAYRCVWDHDESCFIIKGSRIPLGGSSERERARRVVALETVMVPLSRTLDAHVQVLYLPSSSPQFHRV